MSVTRANAERGVARAIRERDSAALKASLVEGSYLSAAGADQVDDDVALNLIRHATKWYAVPGR